MVDSDQNDEASLSISLSVCGWVSGGCTWITAAAAAFSNLIVVVGPLMEKEVDDQRRLRERGGPWFVFVSLTELRCCQC